MIKSVTALVAAATVVLVPAAAQASIPVRYQNCTNLHRYYPHGVGRVGATDHVASGGRPVTTWTRNTTEYNRAVHYNRDLDRDRDGIACEKR